MHQLGAPFYRYSNKGRETLMGIIQRYLSSNYNTRIKLLRDQKYQLLMEELHKDLVGYVLDQPDFEVPGNRTCPECSGYINHYYPIECAGDELPERYTIFACGPWCRSKIRYNQGDLAYNWDLYQMCNFLQKSGKLCGTEPPNAEEVIGMMPGKDTPNLPIPKAFLISVECLFPRVLDLLTVLPPSALYI